MSAYSIREKCSINTNYDADTFVGIKSDENGFSVHFPLGYRISEDEKELRKDILQLISTIASTTAKRDSETLEDYKSYNQTSFPFHAYLYVIYDYYNRGYYKERETIYSTAKQGKINWGRTIKTQRAYIQDDEAYYLNFVVKKNTINENELITLIHEFYVYESFEKVGWLFTSSLPQKPRIHFNEKLFRTVLMNKYSRTFNDKNKSLFQNMLAILDYQGDKDAPKHYRYGTYRFEYVWEALIDRTFGIKGKERYFPKTSWHIGEYKYENASLEPDTIMISGDDVYVLDAKYYKYGATMNAKDLPESTSINKQITYGEYIAEREEFKQIHGSNMKVYNAFLMPFDSAKWGKTEMFLRIGEAVGEWKDNSKTYHRIHGILIDVKQLMKNDSMIEEQEILKLAGLIERASNIEA